ncbi:MAG: SUMF1/EgtB/PvdO family nonheme iron enzyme [Prevotellaceae bacterium]|jgi:formylglycine-generating enzyme required for sulfatase activity|nr:SUMF1/EgtB/PvdO family nonheme iron enzyme [Prevotellaceae bacterium]
MQLQKDAIFDERYRLIRLLGKGGFSEVWLAEDSITDIKVALKVYAPGAGLDDDGIQLFRHEFSLVFDLNHSNLLRPSHFAICNRMPYLIMPFCPRGSAAQSVGKISEEEAWKFLHDVAAGLAYLHGRNPDPVIHQDIKPANVLIDENSVYLITDFGISTKARSTLRRSVGQSQTSGGKTPAYAAPERAGKNNTPIKASDIWALGATVFELLTGDVPFGELGGLFQKGGAEIPDIQGEWSSDLKEIVERCLQQNTWDRPTAEQIVKWTEQRRSGEQIRWEEKRQEKEKKTGRKNGRATQHFEGEKTEKDDNQNNANTRSKKRTALLLCSVLFVLAVTGALVWFYVDTKQQADAPIPVDTTLLSALEDELVKEKAQLDDRISEAERAEGEKVEKVDTERIVKEKTEAKKSINIEMVYVQGGTFTMGCTAEQGNYCLDREKPVHQVTLSSFYIGKYEITQAQWKSVMGNNPSYFKSDNLPVEQVSWDEVQEFIRKLNAQTGENYRLPTEAEWEYAARGGAKSNGYKYSGSNNVYEVAWCYDNSGNKTHPVGTKQANELGIYDMSGNVYEWCGDWYGAYSSEAQTNPRGSSSGSYRVNRGGSWNSGAQIVRVPLRNGSTSGYRDFYLGFRLARSSK